MNKSMAIAASVIGSVAVSLSACGSTPTASSGSSSSAVSSSGGSSSTSTPTESAQGGSSFKAGVLTTPDVRIRITKHRVIPAGKKGNEYGTKPVLAFWYTTTNLSGKKVDPSEFILAITAYQDNNPNAENQLEVGSLPDDRFLESQMETIKKGGTVENAIAYELDDLKTPVDLVASEDLGMSEIGTVTYPVK